MVNENFTWVKTHKEIVEFLATKREKQKDLIQLLKSAGIEGLIDKHRKTGREVDLEEIDPFTFFCFVYKHGAIKRLKCWEFISKSLKISTPTDDLGIPKVEARKVCLFPFSFARKNNEINRLWDFFESARLDKISDDQFVDILAINSVGKIKITEALFNINPEKYFPINGKSKPFLSQYLNIDPEFNNYSEYLSVLKEIRQKVNKPFYELSYEAWKWNDSQNEKNYWIFQGNPKRFDFETAIKENLINEWTVSSHKDKIQKGDKIIFWIVGGRSGCYALGEIQTELYKKQNDSSDSHLWKETDNSEYKVGVKITHNWANQPILKAEIDLNNELKNLNVGNQGTNFTATQNEYETLINMKEKKDQPQYWIYAPGDNAKKWDEFYGLGIMGLGWESLGDLRKYKSRDQINKSILKYYGGNGIKKNQVLANDDFLNKLKVGDIVIAKRGRQEYLGYGIVTSDYYFDSGRKDFNSCRKVDWKKKGVWHEVEHPIVLKTLTDITKYPAYVERLKLLIGISEGGLLHTEPAFKTDISLNTILYGPPGTGKTYLLKDKYMKMFTSFENSITREEFLTNIIERCSWWEVIALALRQLGKTKVNAIYNHPYIAIKSNLSNSNTVTNTIWAQLQGHTIDECVEVRLQKKSPPLIFNKLEGAQWEVMEAQLIERAPHLIEIEKEINGFSLKPDSKIERFEFVTFHQSYSYEDFIEGIKPGLEDSDVTYSLTDGVFKKLCNRARNDKNNNYAIFIDEINRGNIASIFGELITLIEEDKREGRVNEIKATLPYSHNSFCIPPNLYIIGTMNTADRSVEALDTALRRRFSFIEMNPHPSILSGPEYKCDGIDLTAILSVINGRIEKLLDKDYQIGHSYFMNIINRKNPLPELRNIFRNKILPLLQEYFYGDWGKIMLVLGDEFVTRKRSNASFLATDKYENFEDFEEKPIYVFTDSESWTLDTFRRIYE